MSSGSVLPSAERLESLLKVGALPLLGAAFLLTLVLGSFLFPLPSFHTDLAEFSPVSDTDAAEARILAEFGEESRILGVHVTSTSSDGNALSIASLQQQQTDLEALREWASQNGHLIDGSMTAPEIIQRALDEETGDGLSLQDVTSWEQLINETVPEGTQCIDGAADEELVTLAGFAKDALLHRDLVFEETTCAWLDSNRSSGDATPFASSTLWVLYINPDLEDEVRQNMVNLLRLQLDQMEAADGSGLEYGVISNDLISHDINQGTLGNLVWLIAGAVAVVVLLLAIAFRSVQGVAFPLVALSMALVWTYGGLAVFHSRFSVLEVAVAPVVLGLGIDYSIHLQRFYNVARDEGQNAAAAWVSACRALSLPLSIAVVTTIAAFLANVVSPLPPVRLFGLTLAFGVLSAFVTATVVVGSMHVLMEGARDRLARRAEREMTSRFARELVIAQRRTQAVVLVLVTLLTVGSVVIAASRLETEFDLTDFLAEDMEIMQVRDELFASYEVTGWRPIYILIEPQPGADSIVDDSAFVDSLDQMDARIRLAPRVIIPRSAGEGKAMYEGVHPLLTDAIEQDPDFGQRHHLSLLGNELVTSASYQSGDLAAALAELSQNRSLADPLTGEDWSTRVANSVVLGESGGEARIEYMRVEVQMQASSNSEIKEAVDGMLEVVEQSSGRYGMDARMYVTGDLVALTTVMQGLTTSQLESTGISLAVSFIVLLAITRRIGPAVMVITPVAVAAVWVVGGMALLNLNWNVLTVMVTALTIGLGIDYSIHVWQRFEVACSEGMDPWSALRETHATTGVALLLSAGTTICGFLVLRLSPMPVVQDFGIVTAMTVFFSLLLALGLLPILLVMDSTFERVLNGDSHDDS